MDLQILDRQLQELEGKLSTVASRVEEIRTETQTSQAELAKLTDDEKQSAAVRKKLEKELAEGEARIRNRRMRINLVRNDKELQALNHEVDALKENNQRLEAEVLAMMEGVDARAARIKELTELVEEGGKELVAAEKEIAAEIEELKSAISKQKRERAGVAGEIERSLLQRYDMIFSRRQGLAVALVKGGTCQGCRVRIPPQLYNEIQKHLQIHFCPNCQRILYHEIPAENQG
jgi:predicted  nucleic acid-binding Zn-ribbon protein